MRLAGISLQRMSELEIPICVFCHQRTGLRLRRFFSLVSRLGDGHYFYAILLALLWIDGLAALPAIGHASAAGLAGHLLYRRLKRGTARLRPCDEGGFDPTVPALDKYSFPSGHTLHAVCFALVVCTYYSFLGWLLLPFALLIALSRVLLGLHYPTDVVAGATLGASIAWLSLTFT